MPSTYAHTVAEINQQVRALLLEHFSEVVVLGEISGLRRHASGHWYFSLKDPDSEIRCVMFRNHNRKISFAPQDGDAVRVQAQVDLYVQRGSYQLVVENMAPEGRGDMLRKLEELKIRLRAEGLFDPDKKRPLPVYPFTVGVITSPDGAALRDVARTLQRRWPLARLCIYPSMVQGPKAPESLIRSLKLASRDRRCDVLILARGGGSLEDLMPFNNESVVRAVAACPIPLVAGIGHETDTSLADLAADARAATPTAAAEQVSPDATALKRQSLKLLERMRNLFGMRLKHARQELDNKDRRLKLTHPIAQIQGHQQCLDEVSERLARALEQRIEGRRHQLALAYRQLVACSPRPRLAELSQTLQQYRWRIDAAMHNLQQTLRARLERASSTLDAVNPLRTLERGYSIATLKTPTGPKLICKADQANIGDAFELRLADGSIEAEVTGTKTENTGNGKPL